MAAQSAGYKNSKRPQHPIAAQNIEQQNIRSEFGKKSGNATCIMCCTAKIFECVQKKFGTSFLTADIFCPESSNGRVSALFLFLSKKQLVNVRLFE
jgi:hypothetical protein